MKNNRWLCSDQTELLIVISPNFAHHDDGPQRHVQRGRRHATPHLHKGPQGEQQGVYKSFLETLTNRGWTRYKKIAIKSYGRTAPMLTTGR